MEKNPDYDDNTFELKKEWAHLSEEPLDFDKEQFHIEEWSRASAQNKEKAVSSMPLSDIEELIKTAYDIAREHYLRAKRAEYLSALLRGRLAGDSEYFDNSESEKEQADG